LLSLPDKPSIAVLPFTNMSGDPEQEFFSDGMTEDIITALSKLPKLFVVARNSTFTYKGRAVDIRQVGREQGVRYVLEGSVQRGTNRLRITAQLIDSTTGHHIWAQRYDRATQDVFELQDEITREVTGALQVELTEGEQARLWASGTQILEAWEAAIQVPELLHSHRRTDLLPARRLAKRALQFDDNYASAWAMLGWSYWNEAFNGWTEDPDAALDLALDAMQRAHAIDSSNSDTLALLAFLHLSLRKYDEAHRFIESAMALGPNNSFAPAVAANIALFCNKPHDMVPLLKKAMRLCPIYPAWYVGDLAFAYLFMDRHQEAIFVAREAIKIDPDYPYVYQALAVVHSELGQAEEARAAIENILRIEPKSSISAFDKSQPYQDKELRDRMIEGLRKAGLPD
jgi:TolB-like protein